MAAPHTLSNLTLAQQREYDHIKTLLQELAGPQEAPPVKAQAALEAAVQALAPGGIGLVQQGLRDPNVTLQNFKQWVSGKLLGMKPRASSVGYAMMNVLVSASTQISMTHTLTR